MKLIRNSIDSAYSAQVANLFSVLSKSLLDCSDNEIEQAMQKFKKGIHHINHARYLAHRTCDELPELAEDMLTKDLRFIEHLDDMFIECGVCGGKVDLKTGKCPCNFSK